MIRFNVPYISGKELEYITDAMNRGHLSGDGIYTKNCNRIFRERLGFQHPFLTTSGTDALEMAAILAGIEAGDEVIIPSYTFVSTVNAFVLRGARIVFADSLPNHPNIDHTTLEELITPKTRAVVVVHYAGIACDMDAIMDIARRHNLIVIEDAAHSIDARYKDKPLGSIGNFGAFSFHETKNIVCGEGGMLSVNDPALSHRAEIIREKGTNRTAFFRGEIDKYGWVDVGSSFLASEILAAFLFAQLESLDEIQKKRLAIWNRYNTELAFLAERGFGLPLIHEYASNNAHMFYLLCPSLEERTKLMQHLNSNGVKAVFHYQPLHESAFYRSHNPGMNRELPNSVRFGDTLLRLPLFAGLTAADQDTIISQVAAYAGAR